MNERDLQDEIKRLRGVITCLERRVSLRGKCLEQLFPNATAMEKDQIMKAINYNGYSKDDIP